MRIDTLGSINSKAAMNFLSVWISAGWGLLLWKLMVLAG
jgi:hypothetical protein